MEDLGAEEAADLVIEGVAEDGRGNQDAHQHEDVHAAFADRRQRAGHEEQRIAGQEGRHDEAGFGEDNDEQDAVDPQAVLLHQQRQMLVEVEDDVHELHE